MSTETAKHTPGPWVIGKHGRIQTEPNDAGGCTVIVSEDDIGVPANASLIAAAPELLEALCRLLDSPCCNEDDQEDETAEAIRQAIDAVSKAEGR